MYYLYKKKPGDDRSDSLSTNAAPVTLQSNSNLGGHYPSSRSRNSNHPHQRPHPIAEEGNSSGSFDVPEGPLDSSAQQPFSGRRRRPGAEVEDSESKQKDEQIVRRMLRRRGLEEHDFAAEVMQPRRPSRISCQRCQHDIAYNHHRISCSSDQDKHVFCRSCVVLYVDAWVKGEAEYELRHGGRHQYALPCMSPACQVGCLSEAAMQPMLTHPIFTSCRQKLVRARAERSQRGGSAQPRRIQTDMEQDGQPSSQRQPHQQQLYSGLSQQPIHGEAPAADDDFPTQRLLRRQPPDYAQYQMQYQQQQTRAAPPPQPSQKQLQEQEDLRQKEEIKRQQQRMLHAMYHQQGSSASQAGSAAPLPPTILRRTSTSSTATSRRTGTGQRVRFSLKSTDQIALPDDDSSGSSASSLTTRFPTSVTSEARETEKEESQRRHQRRQLAQHPPQQEQQMQAARPKPANFNTALTTCMCCYEEFSPKVSPVIRCDPRRPNEASHHFCGKCVRMYVEEWIFGAATYTPRPGRPDEQGQTDLILPCLHGDCNEGGFRDDQVSQSLTSRSMEQYLSKITPMRIQKQDDEERLMEMAIRLSLEQDAIQRRVSQLHQEQRSVTKEQGHNMNVLMAPAPPPTRGRINPPSMLNIPQTTLSNTSSLTSFNTAFPQSSRSLPDLPRGTMNMSKLTGKGDVGRLVVPAAKKPSAAVNDHESIIEQSVHSVEEAMTQAKVRTCPNCNTKFLKDEDFCNKLKCPSCKTAICYICRQVIPTQGYEHFCIHKQGGCAACLGMHCPLWTQVDDDNRRDMAEMRTRGLDEANRIWEESLLSEYSKGTEIRVDVDQLLQQPPNPNNR
ncbi:IBR domain [Seminavis robusta]|uniref:IBR domain n=1 Tax=Seminavis robusta TaxID=568900 RepID=A0A9N8EEA7_9STRA|nr:IBR domain [Seminavis robusta]|eukprot:Sro998_g229510.1 IBR domain (841) ;mRNA; f:22522-25044